MDLPLPPNAHAAAVLALTVLALVLFTREKTPLESSSFLILILLAVGFQIFPYEKDGQVFQAVDFFHGFGHEALVAVCALMIAGHGIVRTGAFEPVGRALARLWKFSPSLSLLITLLTSAFISAFINNIPVVVLLIPILVSVSLRTGTSASSALMPMGFATLLGGTSTSIGTSTNLLVVSVAASMGMHRFGMFDFLLPAAMAGGIGIFFLWQVAPRILPKRQLDLENSSPRVFSAHLEILEDSPVAGQTLAKARELTDGAMQVSSVKRGRDRFMMPLPSLRLKPGDSLVLRDTPEKLKEFESVLKGTLYPMDLEHGPMGGDNPLKVKDQQIAEVVLVEESFLLGKTLSDMHFGRRYGLIILALHRAGKPLGKEHGEIGEIVLRAWDVLLVQGPSKQIEALKQRKDLMVLDATSDLPFTRKAPVALVIMTGIVLTAALGVLPIAISAPAGAMLMIFTGCMKWRDASGALSAQVIMIVVASLALGAGLVETGGADYLARLFMALLGQAPPAMVVSGLMLCMGILTNIVSNNAAAVIGTPIAFSIATQMGQPPEPFVLAVLFGSNLSYATPMAYQANLLVMNAGKYKFSDFVLVGVPLILIMWLALSFLLPALYGIPWSAL